MKSRAILAASVLVAACGSTPEPKSSDDAPSAARTPEASASVDPSSAEPPAAPAKPRKPFELYNACTDVATIVVGDPKSTDAGRRTVAPFSTIELPRDDDGNQSVWLLDAKGEPLIDVRVTRGMKRVEIGRSCRTLDAR
jgi:hypothetical protein